MILSNTRAAIPAFISGTVDCDKMLENAVCDIDVDLWEAAKKANDDKLRRAFLEDTKDRNHWSSVQYATTSWILEMATRNPT